MFAYPKNTGRAWRRLSQPARRQARLELGGERIAVAGLGNDITIASSMISASLFIIPLAVQQYDRLIRLPAYADEVGGIGIDGHGLGGPGGGDVCPD